LSIRLEIVPWLRSSVTLSRLGSDGGEGYQLNYHAGVFCGRRLGNSGRILMWGFIRTLF